MPNLLKNFTLDKVIAATSPPILQAYFHKKSLLLEIADFQEFKRTQPADDYKKYLTTHILEDKNSAHTVIQDFQKIYTLSKGSAYPYLLSHIKYQHPYLLEEVAAHGLKREGDILFYFINKEPGCVEGFYHIFALGTQPESYWNRRRTDILTRDTDITPQEIESLEIAIKVEVQEITGGRHCRIQHVLCEGKDHLFVLAEDRFTTISQWKDGEPENTLISPTFELAFVYDREEGELDIYASIGGKPLRNAMQLAFSKAVLGKEITVLPKDDEVYALPFVLEQLITNKRVDFCTADSQVIHDIFIRSVKLDGKFGCAGRITLDTKQNDRVSQYQDDIFTELANYLKLNEASANTVDVKNISLSWVECIVIYYDNVEKKDKKKRFTLSGRSGCNLGFDDIDKEIRHCLKEANIQMAGKEHAECRA